MREKEKGEMGKTREKEREGGEKEDRKKKKERKPEGVEGVVFMERRKRQRNWKTGERE